MAIQHKQIPDSELHEPKGAVTAAADRVYVATGTGTGNWSLLDTRSMSGLGNTEGNSGNPIVTNGLGGFKTISGPIFGSMNISNNATGFPITASADTNLAINDDYKVMVGVGAPWVADPTNTGVSFQTDRLVVPVSGIYEVMTWATIVDFPSNTAKVSFKYKVDGAAFSVRNPIVKSNSTQDNGNLVAFGHVALNANSYIQLCLASTAGGNITVRSANVIVKLLKDNL